MRAALSRERPLVYEDSSDKFRIGVRAEAELQSSSKSEHRIREEIVSRARSSHSSKSTASHQLDETLVNYQWSTDKRTSWLA